MQNGRNVAAHVKKLATIPIPYAPGNVSSDASVLPTNRSYTTACASLRRAAHACNACSHRHRHRLQHVARRLLVLCGSSAAVLVRKLATILIPSAPNNVSSDVSVHRTHRSCTTASALLQHNARAHNVVWMEVGPRGRRIHGVYSFGRCAPVQTPNLLLVERPALVLTFAGVTIRPRTAGEQLHRVSKWATDRSLRLILFTITSPFTLAAIVGSGRYKVARCDNMLHLGTP